MDKEFMQIAIDIAKKSRYPFGTVIVKDNQIIGRSDVDNNINKTLFNHAELVAIEDGCGNNQNLYGQLKGCTMYCSCEPCAMCMGAILYEEIDRLVYACKIEDSNQYIVKEVLIKTIDMAKLNNSNITIVAEYMRDQAIEILKNFEF